MNLSEDKQHTLLLVIISLLFILFATGLAVPSETSADTIILPS